MIGFPKSLLIEALKIDGHDKFFYVDTVGKVSEAEIELVGFREPNQLTQQMLEAACLTKVRKKHLKWMSRWWGAGEEPGGRGEQITSTSTRPIALANHRHREIFKKFGAQDENICVVDVYNSGAKGLFINVSFGSDLSDENIPKEDQLEKDVKQGGVGDPIWYVYGPQSKLTDITR